MTVDKLSAALRTAKPSVFGRIQQDRLLLDLRSVFPEQDAQIVDVVQTLGQPDDAAPPEQPN